MADTSLLHVLDPEHFIELRERLSKEVVVMMTYALESGLEIDASIANQLDAPSPVPKPVDMVGPGDGALVLPAPTSSEALKPLIDLHGALVKAVAPATPSSLKATEPAPGPLGFLVRPPLVGIMVLAAMICSAGFILTLPKLEQQGRTPPQATAPAPAASTQPAQGDQVLVAQVTPRFPLPGEAPSSQQWNWIFAAGLGAAFFGLFTAHEFVKNRTFDPRFNSVYLIRFVLGVVAGLILGNLSTLFSNDPTFKALGPGVIALLGGFSAEAVNQVLQRLVEIMVAVVKGGSADVAKAREEQLKTKLASQLASAKQTMSQDLSNVMSDAGVPQPIRDQLKQIQAKLAA